MPKCTDYAIMGIDFCELGVHSQPQSFDIIATVSKQFTFKLL